MNRLELYWTIFAFVTIAGQSMTSVSSMEVEFFEHSNFEGDRLTLIFNECTNLPSGWNDRVSSVNTKNNCVKVFEHGDCRGKSAEVAPGTPSHNHLADVGFHDSISSVDICGGNTGNDHDSSGSGSSSDWQQDGLNLHNEYRKRHNTPPLSLSNEVHRSAQKCAEYLASIKKLEHVCKDRLGHSFGENLGSGYGSDARSAARDVTKSWYNEVSKHDFGNNNFQYPSGHFSQVVWKNSKRIGFGYARNGDFNVIVAHYDPHGNFEGQFLENVRPR